MGARRRVSSCDCDEGNRIDSLQETSGDRFDTIPPSALPNVIDGRPVPPAHDDSIVRGEVPKIQDQGRHRVS